MTAALFAADPPQGTTALIATLWPICVPLLVGGLAIYFLLPRPKAYPMSLGVGASVLALLLGGALLVRNDAVTVELVLFYSFAGLTIVSAALLVTQQHPARAALSFALVVLSTCGLFLLLAAPFLMAATIIIYAGAIVVTFLFVIMLAQQEGLESADARSREPLLATLTGFILLGAILFVLNGYARSQDYDSLLAEVAEVMRAETPGRMRELVGEELSQDNLFKRAEKVVNAAPESELDRMLKAASFDWFSGPDIEPRDGTSPQAPLQKLQVALVAAKQRQSTVGVPEMAGQKRLPMSALSGTPANTPVSEVRRNPDTLVPDLPAENAAFLGRALFTDFLLPVELGGTLLLVATVGAIAICHRRPGSDRSERNGQAPTRSA